MLDRLPDLVNRDDWLVHRGRFVETSFLVEVGERAYLVRVHRGRVESVTPGPFVMPRWAFALRGTAEAWERFWRPQPPPGYHDLLALVRFGRLRVEGDQRPFMANLLYFKDVLARPRGGA